MSLQGRPNSRFCSNDLSPPSCSPLLLRSECSKDVNEAPRAPLTLCFTFGLATFPLDERRCPASDCEGAGIPRNWSDFLRSVCSSSFLLLLANISRLVESGALSSIWLNSLRSIPSRRDISSPSRGATPLPLPRPAYHQHNERGAAAAGTDFGKGSRRQANSIAQVPRLRVISRSSREELRR